jgi:hypothetical protein
MKNWVSNLYIFGVGKENQKVYLSFKALDTIPAIKVFQGSCGCTDFKYEADKKELFVTLRLGTIPPQIQGGVMDISKSITVFYEDDTSEVLYIKGVIKK